MNTRFLIVFFLFCIVFCETTNSQNDGKSFVCQELQKCQKTDGIINSELKCEDNSVTLKYPHMQAIIKLYKAEIQVKKSKNITTKHTMIFKYLIPNGNYIFDNKYDKDEVISYISKKIKKYDLVLSPFLGDALDNLIDDVHNGKNITKEQNGYTIIDNNNTYNGKIKTVVRINRNNSMLVYVEYSVKLN